MMPPKTKNSMKKNREIKTSRSLSTFVKSICDIMRRSNCASALQYVPELTWILFLRILDAQQKRDREAAEAVGESFTPALATFPLKIQKMPQPATALPRKVPSRLGTLDGSMGVDWRWFPTLLW